jgi:steroid 5-alpha reductase family enzyme
MLRFYLSLSLDRSPTHSYRPSVPTCVYVIGLTPFCWALALLSFGCYWILSLTLHRADIWKHVWGVSFASLILVAAFLDQQGASPRKHLLIALITVWGVRLSAYVFWRGARLATRAHTLTHNQQQQQHQTRYEQKHQRGVRGALRSLFLVYLPQAIFMMVTITPALFALSSPQPVSHTFFDYVGAAVWAAGFVVEVWSDLQLFSFRVGSALLLLLLLLLLWWWWLLL